ncbi:MAG: pinensin family lanthipeptide [Cyclobacteriaceae bacterium]
MNTKVKLSSLKIQSFVTDLAKESNVIKGGNTNSCYGGASGGGRTCGNTSCVIH